MVSIAVPWRGRTQEPEWPVLLTVAVALLLGWLIQSAVLGRMQTAAVGSSSVTYPARWVATTESGAAFAAADLNFGGIFAPRVSVRQVAKSELMPPEGLPAAREWSLVDAATAWSVQRGAELAGYRILAIERTQVQGQEAARVEFAYLAEAPQGSASGVLPAVMHAVDTLVTSGEQVHILTFAAEKGEFARLAGLRQRLLSGWQRA
jgi:hypothetical protein